jgi:hypothetical protein
MRFAGWLDQHHAATWARCAAKRSALVKAHLEEAGLTMPSPEIGVELLGDRGRAAASVAVVPSPSPPDVRRQERTRGVPDVSVDRTLEKQIETERQQASESDLLDTKVAPAAKAASSP